MLFCCRLPAIFRAPSWGIFLILASLAWVGTAQESRPSLVARSAKEKSKLREGSKIIDRSGRFTLRLERYQFDSLEVDGGSFTLLENQLLERVSSATSNQDENAIWAVTGVITEYNGNRFLLLERAVLKPRKSTQARE
jgi:hypothetical protein